MFTYLCDGTADFKRLGGRDEQGLPMLESLGTIAVWCHLPLAIWNPCTEFFAFVYDKNKRFDDHS